MKLPRRRLYHLTPSPTPIDFTGEQVRTERGIAVGFIEAKYFQRKWLQKNEADDATSKTQRRAAWQWYQTAPCESSGSILDKNTSKRSRQPRNVGTPKRHSRATEGVEWANAEKTGSPYKLTSNSTSF
ncbi:hypothetical protein Q7P37_010367 [Cladosporium fusiforme]